MSGEEHEKAICPISQEELLKTRLQIAWNWFEFHARQRMSMFYNFLIITGILVNGYALAHKDQIYWMAGAASFLGLFQAVCFVVIDIRNREMIRFAEEALQKLEVDFLFPDGFNLGEFQLGLRRRDRTPEGGKWTLRRLLKMKYPIRAMYLAVFFMFLAACVDSIHTYFTGRPIFK